MMPLIRAGLGSQGPGGPVSDPPGSLPAGSRAGRDGSDVDLFEYQAKELFAKHGVPVLPGAVAETPEQARAVAERLRADGGSGTVVVKAQVKTGGRGKAGGVKLAGSPDEAAERAAAILGMDIKGHTVHKELVTAGSQTAEADDFA